MAHQRRHGEGSITTAGTGVWRAFKPPDATGRRSSRRFTSRDAAHRWLVGEPEPIVLYVGQYLARWLKLRAPTLRGRSVQTYEQFLGYADDTDAPLTSIPLAELTSDDCQAWLNALLRTHTLDSVRVARSVVSAALNAASLSGLVPSNPMRGTKLPKPGEREARAWTPAEVGRLLRAAEGSHHAVWLAFAIGTGLRLGELRALEWSDLDLSRLTVRVSKSLDNNSNARGPTKTGRARTVDIPEELRAALVEHKVRQPAGQRLVFGRDARPYRPQTYRDWLKRLCLRAGVEVLACHSTRHTFASLALADPECALPDVSHALGHAQMATTLNVYGHFISHEQRRTARALGRVLAPASEMHRVFT
jgi:integrase